LNELLVKSATPLAGLPTRPRKPFPKPLIKPFAPLFFAPRIGFLTTPLTPNTTS
jgi:hypothetical protein